MNHEPTFRYYKVEGEALELLRAYKGELDALTDDRLNLEKEFAERAQKQMEYRQANLRTMWRRLAASVGLDPNTTWGDTNYQVEARYLDDGFGAVLYVPSPPNPLQELLGVSDKPEDTPGDPALALPPKGTTRH